MFAFDWFSPSTADASREATLTRWSISACFLPCTDSALCSATAISCSRVAFASPVTPSASSFATLMRWSRSACFCPAAESACWRATSTAISRLALASPIEPERSASATSILAWLMASAAAFLPRARM